VRFPLVRTFASLAPLAACAHGPTLPEAAERMEHDSGVVLRETAKRLGAARPRILADDRRGCPGGKARQVWRGTLRLRPGPDPGLALDDAADVSIGLGRTRGYRLEGPPASAHRQRTFAMTDDASDVRLVMRLRGGRHPSMRLDSSTPCLPRS
jgi:hypothetical protein